MDKNTFKAARDATATDHYSIFIIVSCFGGQKWKRDFAYSSRIQYYQLTYHTIPAYGMVDKVKWALV